jgi:hypothetical protein
MTLSWWRRGASYELRSHDGKILWAVISRRCPFYRVRLYGGAASQNKRTATLRQAMDMAIEWHNQRTA